ncbi:unnamed protein product [Leptidea sinapis]|uniref:C2H2-type domain-containing protein n=1 Tax=Leptidea sinapis TaxID=189913 RepID=A0A5E4QW89_9NEOP|nr:unnamed protein product [Leptidea sinapis]
MRTHTGARPYHCPHCPKKFKAHSVLNHHLLTHSDVRAYKCPFCPKSPFASLYAVRVHMEVHTRQNNLKFACGLCGASYARAFALSDHLKQAHGDAPGDNDITSKEKWIIKDEEMIEETDLSNDLSQDSNIKEEWQQQDRVSVEEMDVLRDDLHQNV